MNEEDFSNSQLLAGFKTKVGNKYLLFNWIDFQKKEGHFLFFDSLEEMGTFEHDNHLKV